MHKTFFSWIVLSACAVSLATPNLSWGQTPLRGNSRVYVESDVRDLMKRLERQSDQFKHHFDHALDHSTLDGTDREDRLKRWTADLEDSLDQLRKNYGDSRFGPPEERVNTVLAIASGINRVMLRRTFDMPVQRDWDMLRSDLNALARVYNLRPLPDFRTAGYRWEGRQ